MAKKHIISTKAATIFPNPLPRGEGGPKGRVRNAGANLEVSTNKQTSTEADVQEEVLGFFVIERLPPAFLISQGIGSEEPIP